MRESGDLLVAVCDNAYEELAIPELIHWSIPDPVRSNSKGAFDDAYLELARRVDDLAPRVAAA